MGPNGPRSHSGVRFLPTTNITQPVVPCVLGLRQLLSKLVASTPTKGDTYYYPIAWTYLDRKFADEPFIRVFARVAFR